MTPQAFIAKWRDNPLTERAGAQAHFEDLGALLEVEPPRIEGEYQTDYTPEMPEEEILRRLTYPASGRTLGSGVRQQERTERLRRGGRAPDGMEGRPASRTPLLACAAPRTNITIVITNWSLPCSPSNSPRSAIRSV